MRFSHNALKPSVPIISQNWLGSYYMVLNGVVEID